MVQTGTVLNGRYEIVRLIAEGGMGAVYEGRDLKFGGGPVAIKRCLMTGEAMQRAFVREAELLANLSHPGVAKARDLFAEPDGQYLVMEFIPGSDLEQILSDQGVPVSTEVALEWVDQALDALSYMHGRRPPVIHRDIKPSNLKLTPSGHVILIDFGLAKGNGTTSLAGYSANYAPLEQLQGDGTDARSDLYALGATLYRLLTGRAPESALDRVKQIAKYQRDPLLSVNIVNILVPETVAQVVRDAMALEPEDRLQSANEMRRRLREAGDSLASSYHWAYAPTECEQVSEKSSKARSVIADGRSTVPFTERLSQATPSPNGSVSVISAPASQIAVETGKTGPKVVVPAPASQVAVETGKTGPKYAVGKYILASGCLVTLLFLGVAGNSYRNWRVERARVEQQEADRRVELPQQEELLNVAEQQRVEQPQQTEPQNSENQEALSQKQPEDQASMETARRRREAAAREAERQRQAATAREADRLRQEIVARELEKQKQEAATRELEKQKAAWQAERQKKESAAREAEKQKQEAATRELEKQKAAWEAERQKAAREAEKQRATWEAERQKAAREAEKQRQEVAARAAEFAKQKEKAEAAARKGEKEAKEVKKQKKREEEKKNVRTGVRVGVSILGGILGPRRNRP